MRELDSNMEIGNEAKMEIETKVRVLLVDDSPEQRREMMTAIADPHLEIVEADSGQVGLDLLRSGDFAVVLIDVRMPGMSGFELAERIRLLEPGRIVPVIFITSTKPPESYMRKGYSLGAVDFLSFPVVPEIVRAKVKVFVDIFHKKEFLARQADLLEEKVRERTAELNYRNTVTKIITDNTASGMFMLDEEKRITFMNPAAEWALGYSFSEVQGGSIHPFVHPPGLENNPCPGSECPLEKALAANLPVQNLAEIFHHKTGRPLHVSCAVAPVATENKAAGQAGTVLEFQDVTEHKKAEDKLAWSEDRYRRLFETAQDGILILDAKEGRILDVNPFLMRILGYSHQELLGKELWEIGLFGDIKANREAFQKLKDQGYVRYDNLPLQTKGGLKREVEFVSNMYSVKSEAVIQCNIRDVTERKLTEEALRVSEADLRQSQKVEALGKLSGGIAHDFNNLLTAINGYSDLCLSLPNVEGAMYDYLSEIFKAGKRAADLTHQLLAFSRKQVLEPKILDMTDVVKEVITLLQRLIGDNIRVTSILDPQLWLIRADPAQMNQVLLNLAINARDALPHGGEITIRTQNFDADGRDGHGPVHSPIQCVVLSITDNGTGMKDVVKDRIFDPFFTTKDFGKGSGMGLAMVEGIVRQSGGRITVESMPEKGSTFKIYFPRVEGTAKKHVTTMAIRVDQIQRTETVLLAEDDPMVRSFVRTALEIHGYKVLEAEDGEKAIELAETHQGAIHILLTDILMPGMNGRRLSELFKKAHPEAPVLFMSGYTDEVIVDQGLLEEGSFFIQKPFAPAQLIKFLKEVLDGNLQHA